MFVQRTVSAVARRTPVRALATRSFSSSLARRMCLPSDSFPPPIPPHLVPHSRLIYAMLTWASWLFSLESIEGIKHTGWAGRDEREKGVVYRFCMETWLMG